MSNPTGLVQKLWNYCNIVWDDGLSHGDYVEQLTFLLFLKMADEQPRPPLNKPSAVPKEFAWPSLLARDGDELDALLPAILQPSLGFRLRISSPRQVDGTGNRAFGGQLVRQHRTDEPAEKLLEQLHEKGT